MLVCQIHYGFTPSKCRLIRLSLRRFEVNQGLEVRGFTVTVFRGAYLSSINDILELKWSISESRLKLSILEKALDISKISKINFINWAIRESYFIYIRFRKVNIYTYSFMIRDISIKQKRTGN